MQDYWTAYGFQEGVGDPLGMAPCIPATGLVKALLERQQPLVPGLTWERIRNAEIVSPLGRGVNLLGSSPVPMDDPSRFPALLDQELRGTAEGHYVNHLAEEDKYWQWDDLCEAMGKATKSDPVMPYQTLTPELSSLWARQRYVAINLLRRVRMDIEIDAECVYGDVHTGVPSSPGEALATALMTSSQGREARVRIGDHRVDIYGPSHGWREGSYCIDIEFVTAIRPLASDIPVSSLMLEVTAFGGNFDPMGTGLKLGTNHLEAGEDGLVTWPIETKRPSDPHPLPVRDVDVPYGWDATCKYDEIPEFHFFHDCDHLVTQGVMLCRP